MPEAICLTAQIFSIQWISDGDLFVLDMWKTGLICPRCGGAWAQSMWQIGVMSEAPADQAKHLALLSWPQAQWQSGPETSRLKV